jgi:transcriptional regulator with XRE-family HTH domain
MATGSNQRFGGRLKEIREKAGITQQQVGARAGIHKLTAAKLEQGLREPSWGTVQALASVLEVTCSAIVGEIEDPSSEENRRSGRPAQQTPELKAPAKKSKK